MPRKVSTGRVGGPVLGSLSTSSNTFSSVETNGNIVFAPDGTGVVQLESNISMGGAKGINFSDNDSSNNILVKAPATVGSNYTLTLPPTSGTSGQILSSDGSGNLSFINTSLTVNDRGTGDGNVYYPAFVTSNATDDEFKISTTLLTFSPNPGRLTTKYLTVSTDATVSNNLTVSNDLTVTQDLSASTITETSSIVYKENINPITDALDAILNLQGVTYDRIGSKKKGEAGLIAEEVAEVIPNIVSYKDGKPDGINYTKLSAYLIEAVKTLTQEVSNLKGKL